VDPIGHHPPIQIKKKIYDMYISRVKYLSATQVHLVQEHNCTFVVQFLRKEKCCDSLILRMDVVCCKTT
jgi:hypothetical protein